MRGAWRLPAVLVLAVLSAAGLAACGGGDSSTASTTAAATTARQKPSSPSTAPDQGSGTKSSGERSSSTAKSKPAAASHTDSGGGSAQFRTPGGDNSIQDSGAEGSSTDLAQASAALHAYLDARAAGQWSKACSYMAAGARQGFRQLAAGSPQLKGKGCAAILAALSSAIPEPAKRESTQADVGALRVKGGSAFLLYHGAHGTDYFMPMTNEGGRWKVGALAASALP